MPTKMLILPSQTRLLELLSYDPTTGVLRWRVARANGCVKPGQSAGTKNRKNIAVFIDGRLYTAHRLIWKMVMGRDPVEQIDHRNGNPHDNCWNNLREATPSENTANRGRWRRHIVGLKGVRINGSGYAARIQINKNRMALGTFKTAEEAHAAYIAAAKVHFKDFSNSG